MTKQAPHHKIRVGIMFGGKSAEHEVSLRSAKNVLEALDPNRYDAVLIGIDKDGSWHHGNQAQLMGAKDGGTVSQLTDGSHALTMVPGGAERAIIEHETNDAATRLDVVLPILHGPMGEDGTVQGLLELADLPYVGPSVLGAAIGMDKDVMKRLLRDAGIQTARYQLLKSATRDAVDFGEIIESLGLPLFVKPANMGSSVGVSKAHNLEELEQAVSLAFDFDTKVIVEEAIVGAEVECAVLGNAHPEASVVGKIIPTHEFYSYESKYLDENGAVLEIPAKLSPEVSEAVRAMALKTYEVLEGQGMARVDMFVTEDNTIFVNEVNTIPGFTSISMYPKLWEASGIGYSELIGRLIELAIERHAERSLLRTSQ